MCNAHFVPLWIVLICLLPNWLLIAGRSRSRRRRRCRLGQKKRLTKIYAKTEYEICSQLSNSNSIIKISTQSQFWRKCCFEVFIIAVRGFSSSDPDFRTLIPKQVSHSRSLCVCCFVVIRHFKFCTHMQKRERERVRETESCGPAPRAPANRQSLAIDTDMCGKVCLLKWQSAICYSKPFKVIYFYPCRGRDPRLVFPNAHTDGRTDRPLQYIYIYICIYMYVYAYLLIHAKKWNLFRYFSLDQFSCFNQCLYIYVDWM